MVNNAQSQLLPIEIGRHARGSQLSQEDYGKAVGLSQQSISIRVQAARVADTTDTTRVVDADRWRHLAEIHAAPEWMWPTLVGTLLTEEGDTPPSVDSIRKTVKPLRHLLIVGG